MALTIGTRLLTTPHSVEECLAATKKDLDIGKPNISLNAIEKNLVMGLATSFRIKRERLAGNTG